MTLDFPTANSRSPQKEMALHLFTQLQLTFLLSHGLSLSN